MFVLIRVEILNLPQELVNPCLQTPTDKHPCDLNILEWFHATNIFIIN